MPLKRHPALQNLSRDHHIFLLQSRNIRWLIDGHERAEPLDNVVQELLTFWKEVGEPHIREEEEILFPLYLQYAPLAQDDIDSLITDHNWLRDTIQELSNMPRYENTTPLLRSLESYIESHVRNEERVIFESIQNTLEEEQLQQYAKASNGFRQLNEPVADDSSDD